jgi:hypothetical protein
MGDNYEVKAKQFPWGEKLDEENDWYIH